MDSQFKKVTIETLEESELDAVVGGIGFCPPEVDAS